MSNAKLTQIALHRKQGLKVAVLDALDMGETGYANTFLITRINVPKEMRRKGVGTDLLTECCRIADEEQICLVLEIVPYYDDGADSIDTLQLAKWYERFGFEYCFNEQIKTLSQHYRRFPKSVNNSTSQKEESNAQ